MSRPKGSKNKPKVFSPAAVPLSQTISKKIEALEKQSPLEKFIPVAPKPKPAEKPAVQANLKDTAAKDVVCVGGPTPGKKVKGATATRTLDGYIMREIKRPNPEYSVAAPESVYVYVPDTLKKEESLTIFLLDKYLELLYK